MGPKKSEVWTHFSNEYGGKVKCLYCGITLSVKNKSTSTLIRHMKYKHSEPYLEPITIEIVEDPLEAVSTVSTDFMEVVHSPPLTKKRSHSGRPSVSSLWAHFTEKNDDKVDCLYCGQTLSVKNKSTSTLIRHMKHIHPTHPISIEKATEASVEEISTASTQFSEAASPTPRKRKYRPVISPGVHRIKSTSEFVQKSFSVNKKKEMDRQLVCMITKEYHPLSIVEDAEFKRLVHLLNPIYNLPTRKIVSDSLIPAFYNETVDIVKHRLERASAVCLTTDRWTIQSNDSFYSITAHYVVEELNNTSLTSDLLGSIPYSEEDTAEDIYDKLKEIIDEWKITNKISVIVSDYTENIKAAVQIGGWHFWGCFANSLNLIAQSGLSEIEEVVDKIRIIVSYFKKSSYGSAQLKDSAELLDIPLLKLKNEIPACWNSTFDMINRVLTMKNAITSSLTDLNTPSCKNEDEFEPIVQLQDEEWMIAEESVKVLEIFNLVTSALSSEQRVSASTIMLYYNQIIKHLNTIGSSTVTPPIQNMIKRLRLELKDHFQDIEENKVIAQATILDPRFKKFGFVDEKKYKRAVESLYTQVAITNLLNENPEHDETTEGKNTQDAHNTSSEKEDVFQDLWKDFDVEIQQYLKPTNPTASAMNEVDKYLDEPILPRKDSAGVCQDPLVWWHERRYIYPKLYKTMKTRLCVMATSVPGERIFSKVGQMVAEKRGRLETDKISQFIFLSYNLNNGN